MRVWILILLFAGTVYGQTASGPITIDGQSNVTISGKHVTSTAGDCVTITNSVNVTIQESEIGPCAGNGIVVTGGSGVQILDNYIHPEAPINGCCDMADGVFSPSSSELLIQGNVIAYGEANIEANSQTNLKVTGNFLLNPRGGGSNSRGQNVQVWGNSTGTLVNNNYTLSSDDTTKYKFAELQEDSINFGAFTSAVSNGATAQNNYVTGGKSNSGCGIIADSGQNSVVFQGNVLLNTGQCGIGIADGTNQVVESNKVLNTTPVSGGGNTAIYVWKVIGSDPPCGPVQILNNIASEINTSGSQSGFWNGGGCEPVTVTGNTFDAAAVPLLTNLTPPLIPPLPAVCAIASPWTNNTLFSACGGVVISKPNPPTGLKAIAN